MKKVEELFGTWVQRHVVDGVRLDPHELCGDDDAALKELMRCIAEYDDLQETLVATGSTRRRDVATSTASARPASARRCARRGRRTMK